MTYLYAFLCGGALCAFAQILIDKTKIKPARILVFYVLTGILLTGIGVYKPFVEFAGAGATVPIIGFGYTLAEGVKTAVDEKGALGILTGGLSATSAGIAAVLLFGFIAAAVFKSRQK